MNTVEKIIGLIEEKKIQYKDFASNLGLAQNIISEWKNKRLKPSIEHIIKIADYFNVSTDYLLDRVDIPDFFPEYSKKEQSIIKSFRSLNEGGQEKVIDYIDDIATSGKYIKNIDSGMAVG